MAYEAAGRDRGIHDIYIFSNLKHFLINRIGYKPLPVPRAVFPARLSFRHRRPPYRPAVPMWRGDCVHVQATDRAHDHAFDRFAPFVPSPVPCLSPLFPSRPSHLFISSVHLVMRSFIPPRACRPAISPVLIVSPVLVACPRPVPLPAAPTSRAGRDVSSRVAVLPPHVRRFHLVSSCEMSWNVVGCRKVRKGHRMSWNWDIR